ncbi:MAG: hypothetical protein QG597_4008 [Actinomycetota bacterium]|jgi:hypothetical protein|nr:hypothetical protein [Actinomycetota bacterium]
MGKPTPLRSGDNKHLAGSIGAGRDTVPTPVHRMPVTEATRVADDQVAISTALSLVRGRRCACGSTDTAHVCPTRARMVLTTLRTALAGRVSDPDAVIRSVQGLLDDDGAFPVHVDAWEPTSTVAIDALRRGHIDVYEALAAGADAAAADAAAYRAAWEVDDAHPGTAIDVNKALQSLAVVREGTASHGVFESLVTEGMLSRTSHPFLLRVDSDFRIRGALPVTVAQFRDFMASAGPDRRIASLSDLALATYATGDLRLDRGAWTFDTDAVAHDTVAQSLEMEDEAVYQALALVYSSGRSGDGAFQAGWSPTDPHAQVPAAVREWLDWRGRTNPDDAFGRWAMRPAG